MDIHKPKAAHSWREFAVEIGTIICGILIALGLEQAVEAMREGHNRTEARENIRDEIGRNLDAMDRRTALQGCIDRRLDDVQALIADAIAGKPTPHPLWIGRPQIWGFNDQRFQAASSGGRASLLSSTEQARFGQLYGIFRNMNEEERTEQLAWAHLRVLEVSPKVDAVQASALLTALQEARYANFSVKILIKQAHDLAKTDGLKTLAGPFPSGSASACVPLNTSRTDAMALIAAKAGRAWTAEP